LPARNASLSRTRTKRFALIGHHQLQQCVGWQDDAVAILPDLVGWGGAILEG
jgi:hypothetical protein